MDYKYFPHTDSDIKKMLHTIGIDSLFMQKCQMKSVLTETIICQRL